MPPAEGDSTHAQRRSSQGSVDISFPSLDNVDATSSLSDGVATAQNGSTQTLAMRPELSTHTTSPDASCPRASSVSDMTNDAKSPQQLVRRLSLAAEGATVSNPPATSTPDLPGFSGNVISVNFCIPYKVEYNTDHDTFVCSSPPTSTDGQC